MRRKSKADGLEWVAEVDNDKGSPDPTGRSNRAPSGPDQTLADRGPAPARQSAANAAVEQAWRDKGLPVGRVEYVFSEDPVAPRGVLQHIVRQEPAIDRHRRLNGGGRQTNY